MVWAWNRRSAGSWYSAAQARTCRKAAIVVVGPVVGQVGDHGVARSAVGARDERVPVAAVGGVASAPAGSRRRSRCRAAPACACRLAPVRLSTIAKPGVALAARGASRSRLSIRAIGGGVLADRGRRRRRRLRRRPPTRSAPNRRRCRRSRVRRGATAARATAGRNPTPWTTPVMSSRTRTVAAATLGLLLMDLLSSTDSRVEWAVRHGPVKPRLDPAIR